MRSRVDEVRLIDPPTIKRPREGYTFFIVKVINEDGNYFYPWQWLWGLEPPGDSSHMLPASILVQEGYGQYRESPYPTTGSLQTLFKAKP